MKEYLIIGGGIDALITALMLKINQQDSMVIIKTQNSDPREDCFSNPYGATWSGLSPRHITHLEGYNRNILQINDSILQNTVDKGGWLGKNLEKFSVEEKKWLARRLSAQHFTHFNQELYSFYKEYNKTSINIWHRLINEYKDLFHDVHISYNMKERDNKSANNAQEFTLLINKLVINIINYLEKLKVNFQFNVKVTLPQNFQNIIIMVGAYDHNILKNVPVKNSLFAVAGTWLTASLDSNYNFHIKTENLWEQNYSHISNHNYIVSGGYAIAGFNFKNLDINQKNALIKRNIKIANQYCNNVKTTNKICFRGFTDNDIPLLSSMKDSSGKNIIVAGGMNTGTTTAAPLTGQIISNILLKNYDPWMNKLFTFKQEWQHLMTQNHKTFLEYYNVLSNKLMQAI